MLTVSVATSLAASVTVTVSGAVANGTFVMVGLCSGDLEPASCKVGDAHAANAGTLSFVFNGIAKGKYALAAFQDINGDGKLDRTKLGLPLEPFAFSRDAGVNKRPIFDDAAFDVSDDPVSVALRLRGISRAAFDQK